MTIENIISVLGIVLSSKVLAEIFKWWVGRSTAKGKAKKIRQQKLYNFIDRFEEMESSLESRINEVQMNQLRANLLILLTSHRNNPEIPHVGEEYVSRGGNSYIIPLLLEWYDEKKLNYPEWLVKAKKEREIEE